MHQSSEIGFIGELFNACIRALATLVANCDAPEMKPRIQEERGRLALWGDGFGVYEGELDRLLETSDHLKESTVVLLVSIASTIVKHLDSSSDITKSLSGLIEKAEKLVPETVNYVDQSDNDSDAGLSDTVGEIKDFNDSLYDLVPFLEIGQIGGPNEDPPIPLVSPIPELSSSAILPNLCIEAQSYQRNILDKFPKADMELVAVMAELNWLRHERIRNLSNKDQDEHDFEESFPVSEVDTSTIPTSFQPSSIFSKAPSETSAGTSVYESNEQGVGYVRFPLPPVKLGLGKPFTCTICFQTLKNIDHRAGWRAHVLKDLQPYSCTFTSCPAKNETFGTRKSWLKHEFDNHRFTTEWVCIKDCGKVFLKKDLFVDHTQDEHLSGISRPLATIELETMISRCEQRRVTPKPSTIRCPFCCEKVEETRIALHSHMGIHMEEIALTALPQDIWRSEAEENYDDDGDAGNQESDVEIRGERQDVNWDGGSDASIGSETEQRVLGGPHGPGESQEWEVMRDWPGQEGGSSQIPSTYAAQKRVQWHLREDQPCDVCKARKVKCDATDITQCSRCASENLKCQFTAETNRIVDYTYQDRFEQASALRPPPLNLPLLTNPTIDLDDLGEFPGKTGSIPQINVQPWDPEGEETQLQNPAKMAKTTDAPLGYKKTSTSTTPPNRTSDSRTMFWVCCGGKSPASCPAVGAYIAGLTVQCEDPECGHNRCSQCAVFPAPIQ